MGAPRAHPEIAKITDDHQRVVAAQSAQPGAKAAIAIGSVVPEMNIAGEVVRHGRNFLAVVYSWSESPNKRPVTLRTVARSTRSCRGSPRFSPPGRLPHVAGGDSPRPDPEIGKSRALPRRVNLGKTPRRTDGVSGRLDRQMRLIALLAQVE